MSPAKRRKKPAADKPRRARNGSAAASRAQNGKSVDVRMYNVGFGDCFLLRVPTAEGERRVLVDCGFHSQGKGKFSDKQLVEQIKADLRGQSLHVVVATHRHQDHISGFGETKSWEGVSVEEVWLPFTADESATNDGPANRAWRALMDAAGTFLDPQGKLNEAALRALGARDAADQAAVEFMLWNARSNTPGIENLLRGFKGSNGRAARRRFLPEDKGRFPSTFDTPVLPGVTVHVLGPPRDPKLRKQMKVPSSWGVREAAFGAPTDEIGSPFPVEWRIAEKNLLPSRPFSDSVLNSIRLFNDDLLRAATALDGFLNGESLVLVLEFGAARLLLPGDAEVGAWTAILSNPDALKLAAEATFLKVGHHGSHNATPLMLVREHLAKRTPAVMSTQEGPGSYRNNIPFDKLLAAITDRKMPFVRSDEAPSSPKGVFTPDADGRWVDCSIPC